jgi:hypothetical protein
MKHQLTGLKLVVESISRKGIFDCDMAYSCENCGKTIVNYANVTDGKKSYIIGLDCKKNLIDKPKIDEILGSGEWDAKFKAKDYKSEQAASEKLLTFLIHPERYEIKIDSGYTLYVTDIEKETPWGTKGLIVYSENARYLFKIGLEATIKKLIEKRQITYSKY